MSSLNNVVLVGRLTRDPELKYTPSGQSVCNFTLAIDRAGDMVDGEAQAGFFDVEVWGNQAENSAQYLARGRMCGVVGGLRLHKWEAQDGTKRSKVSVIARQVQFLSPRGEGQQDGDDASDAPTYTREPVAQTNFGASDEDIPFHHVDFRSEFDYPLAHACKTRPPSGVRMWDL